MLDFAATTATQFMSPGAVQSHSDWLSALDVLADQAAASQTTTTTMESPPTLAASPLPSDSCVVAPVATDVEVIPVEDDDDDDPEANKAASPSGKSYVRWNLTEDELLVRGVIAHGHRWDAVASCVPNRTYHQCRQRWIRGLRCESESYLISSVTRCGALMTLLYGTM